MARTNPDGRTHIHQTEVSLTTSGLDKKEKQKKRCEGFIKEAHRDRLGKLKTEPGGNRSSQSHLWCLNDIASL